jgi:hypothetical protein
MPIQKIKSGRVITVESVSFVGESGTIFYDEAKGDLRLGDGVTPGGRLLSVGSGVQLNIVGTVATIGDLPNIYSGDVGDIYLVQENNHLYTWSGLDWLDLGNIVGPTGFTGSAGTNGQDGASGFTGSAGLTGSQGYIGSIGFTGSQGILGFTGSSGQIGFTGSQGYIGSQGTIGFTGSQGQFGYTGSQGLIGFTGSQGEFGYTGSQGEIVIYWITR